MILIKLYPLHHYLTVGAWWNNQMFSVKEKEHTDNANAPDYFNSTVDISWTTPPTGNDRQKKCILCSAVTSLPFLIERDEKVTAKKTSIEAIFFEVARPSHPNPGPHCTICLYRTQMT